MTSNDVRGAGLTSLGAGAGTHQDTAVDVVVIGAGPAGEVAAGRAAEAGLSVAIVEVELVGGECSFWGCMPSKVLLRPGDVRAAAGRVPGLGAAAAADVDVEAVLARRDRITGGWDDAGQVPWLEQRGVALVRGAGRLAGERTVAVAAPDGTTRHLRARRAVVIATGSRSALPPVEGLGGVRPWDNRDVTALKAVPRRLLVLGGGAVGLEMAQAVRRLGAQEVTVVEAAERLLVREEPFAGAEVAEALRAEGIVVLTGTALRQVRRAGADGPVSATTADGRTLETDEILVAAGRRPATDTLGLETVGLRPGGYLPVDDRLRVTGVEGGWLYAVGDVNGLALLTHVGKYQGRIAADVIAGRLVDGRPPRDRASRDVVPRVTFTDPQVCAVGLTEAQAAERGLPAQVIRYGTGDVAGAATRGRGIAGTSQLVIDTDRQVLVGATFVGPDTQELLHSATVAIAGEVPLDRLWHAVPSFPTVSEVWLRLLEAAGL
jgi:pyruvate/2-oxoglutarate dehydrogenase complex dihydrolipoamide dehydrogenase (E3) component